MKSALFSVVLFLGILFVNSGCEKANASSEVVEQEEKNNVCCKLVESAPIWFTSTLCPKEIGWHAKGLGVDKYGKWKALCSKTTIACACELK